VPPPFPPKPPCPPCPPCPEPPEIFVAGGIGRDPQVFLNNILYVSFGPALIESADTVMHVDGSAEFEILESGFYEINYQLSAYNTALLPSLPIQVTVGLFGSISGVISSDLITAQFELLQRRVVVELSAGEIITLQASQSYGAVLRVNSQTISIVKLP